MTLLQVDHLSLSFSLPERTFYALRDVSFAMQPRGTLGIIGESGSGKTSLGLAIAGLLKGAAVEGSILYRNIPLYPMKEKEWQKIRGKEIGFIPQDPMSALTPTMRIGQQILEGILYHRLASPHSAKSEVLQLLDLVGIQQPEICFNQYPHQLSGGQKQRILIAIALSCRPKLLIADEPTTALDAPLRGQILRLLQDVQQRFDMGLLIISHDKKVISHLCDRTLAIQKGKCIEPIFFPEKPIFRQSPLASRSEKPLLEVQNLSVAYTQGKKIFHAVDSISFSLYPGDT
ncbi:MAG TPA: ABC transporter ATP-binding protein, partial [Parachlamydiales bacterium]|nr:ABC transporter ATP-binding protein [Parachlamydiales bacterium]